MHNSTSSLPMSFGINTSCFMRKVVKRSGLMAMIMMIVGLFVMNDVKSQSNTGLLSPTTSQNINSVTSHANGLTSNNVDAVFDASGDAAGYGGFNISIPPTAIIVGIEVLLEGARDNNRDLTISLTSDNGANYTAGKLMPAFGTLDAVRTVGGAFDTWGRTWTIADLSNSNFGVRCLVPAAASGDLDLDHVQVRVYYAGSPFTITATGNGSFTVPDGTSCIKVEAWGGGGRGGSRTSGDNLSTGGGGGGAYASTVILVTPGQTFNYSIGSGSTSTASGGSTWFNSTGFLNAGGGNTPANNSATGATGGAASGTALQVGWSGGRGANGFFGSGTDFGGGGGSSASNISNGNDATNQNGATIAGGGNGGNGHSSSSSTGSGSAGQVPGGGGGGAVRYTSGGSPTGGNGANGQIIISWGPALEATNAPVISIPVCVGANSTVSGTSENNATITIYVDGSPVATSPATITADGSGNWSATIPSNISVGSAVTATAVVNGKCTSVPSTSVIASLASISLTSDPGTDAQSVCDNTAIQAIVYNVDAPNVTVDGLPAGVNYDFTAGVLTISGTPQSVLAFTTYNYTITTIGAACNNTKTGSITVAPAIPAANAGPDKSICHPPGTGVTSNVLEATAAPDGMTGTWSVVSGPSTSLSQFTGAGTVNNPNAIFVPAGGPGDYTLQWTITNPPCAGSQSDEVIITVLQSPESTNGIQTICTGNASNFDVSTLITNAVGSTFTWVAAENINVTGESTSPQSGSTITDVLTNTSGVQQIVTYTVTPTGTGNSCVGPNFTVTVTVDPLPVADFSATSLSINTGQSVDFTDLTTNNPTSWSWTFAGGSPSSSSDQNPTGITYNTAGSFDVTLTSTNACGSDIETKLITASLLISPQVYNSSGNFVIPPGVSCLKVEAWGGGGAGGGATRNFFGTITGGGGAGGAYAAGIVNVTQSIYPVTVAGQKTATATSSATDNTGNPSWFGNTSLVFAEGGQGGSPGDSFGDQTGDPGTGSNSSSIGNITTIPGSNGSDGSDGGAGGAGANNGGTGGTAVGGNSNGNPGTAPGGGGSGGRRGSTGSEIGGTGAEGMVIVSWIDVSNFTLSTLIPSICQNQDGTGTITSTTLGNGTYLVNYSLSGANTTAVPVDATMIFNSGTGTFTIPQSSLFNPGETTITVNSIAFEDGGCQQTPVNNTTIITIQNAIPVLTSATGTDAQTLCVNTAIQDITYEIVNSINAPPATGAIVTDLPTGVSGSYNAGIVTISGTPSVSGSFTYTVTPTGTTCVTPVQGTIVVNPIPAAEFSASTTTVAQGSPVTFTDQSTGEPTSWSWSFPGGTPSSSTAQNPVVAYAAPGTYAVTLTATNDCGFDTETKTSYITVTALGTCVSGTIWTENFSGYSNFANSGSGSSAVIGNWSSEFEGPDDGVYVLSGQLRFEDADDNGNDDFDLTLNVSGYSNVVISIPYSSNGSLGSGDDLVITYSVDGGPNVTLLSISNDQTGTATTPPLNGNVITINIDANVADEGDYFFIDNIVVTGAQIPATVNDPADVSYCHNQLTTPIVFTGTATSYIWTNDNPSIGLAASGVGDIPAFTAINTGSTAQVANITVTPSNGVCAGEPQTFTITVNSLSTAPASALSTSTSICNNTQVTLTQDGGVLGSGAEWKWYSDAGFSNLVGTSTAADANVLVTVNTIAPDITYYVRAEGPCGVTEAASVTVSVQQPPSVEAGAFSTTICAGDVVGLFADLSFNVANFVWSSTTGGSFSFISGSSATYTPSAADIAAGEVTLTLTANPISPCAVPAVDNITIIIREKPVATPGSYFPVCSNDSLDLAGQVSGYNVTGGVWSTSGTGSFYPNEFALDAKYIPSAADSIAGMVTLTLTTTGDIAPCSHDAQSVVVNVLPAPAKPQVLGPSEVCPLQNGILYTLNNYDFNLSYTWSVFNNEGTLPFDAVSQAPHLLVNAGTQNNSSFTIQLIALDESNTGCQSDTSFVVNVVDSQLPLITCPPTATANTSDDGEGNCSTTVDIGTPTTSDNCSVVSVIPYVGGVQIDPVTYLFPTGTTVVSWVVTDAGGNVDSCHQNVLVIDDENPTITCPANVNANTSDDGAGNCTTTVALGVPGFGDNCAGATIKAFIGAVEIDPLTYEFSAGITTVTWVVTDTSGNFSSCDQLVTVVDDEPPTITCPGDVVANTSDDGVGNCTTTVDLGTPGTGSNCEIADVIAYVNGSPIDPVTYPFSAAAPTTVMWVVTDTTGNADTCYQLVTIIDDESPIVVCPVAENADRNTDLDQCTYTVQGTEFDATATDNCNLASLTYTLTGATFGNGTSLDGVQFNKGVTTVTWTASDGLNPDDICSFTVNVTDIQPPYITCAADTLVDADPFTCNRIVNVTPPTAFDNCGNILTLLASRPGGLSLNDPFPIGTTTITWTAIDTAGNSAFCLQDVTVNGEVAVNIACAPTLVVTTTPNLCTAVILPSTLVPPTITMGCGSVTFTRQRSDFLSFNAPYPIGNTIITWSAINGFGDVVAVCQQTITVVDGQAPTITSCPNTLNIEGCGTDAILTQSALAFSTVPVTITSTQFIAEGGSVTENCGSIASITYQDVVNGTCPIVVTRTFTITDAANNASSCDQIINIDDNTAPVWTTLPNELDVTLECSDLAGLTAAQAMVPVASDNCDTDLSNVVKIEGVFVPGTSCAQAGTYTNTWTVMDECGNVSDVYTQVITLKDETPPTFTVPADIEIFTDANCAYDASVGLTGDVTDEADNCATGIDAIFTDAIADGACTGSKVITRTWTLSDGCNTTTHVQIITVTDNTAPTFTAPADIEIFTDANCAYDATVGVTGDVTDEADNCSTGLNATFTDAIADGACAGSKVITRTWSLTDDCGNTTTKDQVITVTDNTAPTFTVPADIEIFADANCAYDATVGVTGDVTDEADNCSTGLNATFTDVITDGACAGSKVITRTWTLSDGCNTTTHVQTITVSDNTAPTVQTQNITVYLDENGQVTVDDDAVNDGSFDNCSSSLTFVLSQTTFTCGDTGPQTVTLTVTDECGNSSEGTATITVVDDIDPVITNVPADFSINAQQSNCNQLVTWTAPTAGDNCGITSFTSNQPFYDNFGFVLLPVGVHTIIYTAVDNSGNTSTASFTVTVVDNQPPVINNCPSDIVVNATGNTCGATVIYQQPSATDNCGAMGVDLVINNPLYLSGNTFPVGVHNVEWIATDAAGLKDTCSFTVTVVDATPPVITCPANITVSNDVDVCGAIVNFEATAVDNCGGLVTITYSQDPGTVFPVGSTLVTATAVDGEGNESTCTFTVTVNDTQAPLITCPADMTVDSDAGSCSAIVNFAATVDDNCEGAAISYLPASGSSFPIGQTLVTATATDASGNQSSCTFTVTVVDNEPPVIICPVDIVKANDPGTCGAVVTFSAGVLDNCDGAIAVYSHASGSVFPVGTTEVSVYAQDAKGNVSATCTFEVTVNDTEAPIITVCPADIEVGNDLNSCSAVVTYSVAAMDNCTAPENITYTYSHAPGSVFPIGTTTVTVTAQDAVGNSSTACTFDVTVNDTQAPAITCPADINVSNDAGQCSAIVNFEATALDNCGGAVSITYSQDPGTSFPIGETVVIVTATDDKGNASNCSFTVTVNDTEAPVITSCPADIVVDNDLNTCSAVVNFSVAATDNCTAPENITYTYSHAPGSVFPIGTTTVTVTAQDAAGNSSTACSFDVTVNDTQAPVVTCPADITQGNDAGQCGAIVNFEASATDNCNGEVTITYSKDPGTLFPVGETVVVVTATDEDGNQSTCSFTVTVNDTEGPVITSCPADIVVGNDLNNCSAAVNFSVAATDNCTAPENITYTYSHAPGSIFPVGTTVVTVTAHDAAGNSSTTCTFSVTVNDTQAPIITCPADVVVNNDPGECGALVDLTATAVDNCGSVTITYSPNLTIFPVGTTLVTATATDAAGNSSECQFSVTVQDNQLPSLMCPSNITKSNDPGMCGAVVTFSVAVNENCGFEIDYSHESGDFFPIGTTVVTVTATDGAGNVGTCTFNVTVEDNDDPVFTACPADIVVDNAPGSCGANVFYPPVTYTDNCASTTISYSKPSGSFFSVGETLVTVTATDNSGNTAICEFTVTVNDTEPPAIACPLPIVKNNDPGMCGAVVTFSAGLNDNCVDGTTIEYSLPSGHFFPIGTTIVTVTAGDQAGNSASCSFSVTVNDTEPPVTPVLPEIVTDCAITLTAPTTTDNCAGTITGQTSDPVAYSEQGSYMVTWTFSDGNGNTVTAQQSVTIDDNSVPTIICPDDINVGNDPNQCGAVVNFPPVEVTDNCSDLTVEYSHNSGDFFPVGTTTVTVTVTDAADNTAECTFNITVNDAQSPVPAITSLPTVEATCSVTVDPPTASDNCDGLIAGETVDPVSFNTPGVYTINWTYTDEAGNSAAQSQSVIVQGSPGVISSDPASLTRCEGESATFSVTGVGTGYQWEINTGSGWNQLPGQNGATLTIAAVTPSMNGDQYRVIVFGDCGGAESNPATLTVNASPIVYSVSGGGATCSTGLPVGLSGSQAGVNYQLRRDNINTGSPVAGTGGAIDFGSQTQSGTYTVVATSAAGCSIQMNGSAVITAGVLPAEFDVTGGGFVCGGTGAEVGLDDSETGVSYQLRRLTLGGPVDVGSPVAGTGSAISFGSQADGGIYNVLATNVATGCTREMDGAAVVIPGGDLPTVFSMTGGGTVCGAGGVPVGISGAQFLTSYQLYRDGQEVGDAVFSFNENPLEFGTFTQSGVYTVVATNILGCSVNMSGSVTIVTGTQPTLFTVTGGGTYCEGGSGTAVGLSGSQTGVSYQLRKDNVNTGSPVAGTGNPIGFGNQTAGVYTVVATHSTGCTATMTGSVTVTQVGLPTVYNVTGGGGYCSGPGPEIGLSGSQAGVSYQLRRNGVNSGAAVTGTGSAISFGNRTQTGTYTVVATATGGCISTMSGSAIISAGVLPVQYDVTGGGVICGGVGPVVGLNDSQTGVNYQLRRTTLSGTVNVGSPVPGTGSAISFGNQNIVGSYTVVATNPTTGCTRTMDGSVILLIDAPLPTAFTVTGGGTICGAGGVTIGLSGSQFLTSYQLQRNGVNVGGAVTSFTGSALSFGTHTQSGVYTVVATNLLGCSNTMNGSATIVNGVQPFQYQVMGGGSTCDGSAGIEIRLSDSDPGVTYQLRRNGVNTGSPVAGNGLQISLGFHTVAGTYTVMATHTSSGCTRLMAGSAVITGGVAPEVFTMTGGGAGGSTSSIFPNNVNPAVDLANDGGPLELGMKFTSTQNGFITGIKYWKDDDATGTHIGNLWSSTGTLLASATFGAGPVEGWQTVTFSTPVPITAGVTYVASYFSQSGDYAATDNYFGSSVVNGPLRALANGEQGPNGVYKYTAIPSFPTTGYQSSNYWVDVVFSSGSGVSYCGGPGPVLGLSGSQSGVNYQLMKDGIPTGAPVAGTGNPISFGAQTQLGNYTAVATNATTSCTQNMAGNVMIQTGTLPTAFSVTGGGSFCSGPGPLVGLNGSQVGVNYQLRRNSVNTGSPVAGTGAAISFGNQNLAGTYTVVATNNSTGCVNNMTGSATVTISGSLPATSITYNGNPFCPVSGVNVTRTGMTGGTYSSTAGLSINVNTGRINLAASTPGTYTVTYSYGNATCSATATTSVTILPIPTATISYVGSPFCNTGTVTPIIVGQTGGTFTASRPGLSLNSATGAINLAASEAGNYRITYTFSNGACSRTTTALITIGTPPVATISYNGSPYCQTGVTNVTRTGTGGGTYTSTPGLVINPANGQINLGASTPGTYTVTYNFSNSSCSNSTSTTVTIMPNVPFTFSCPANIINVPSNPGACFATGVNLGTPTVNGCGNITVTNNAPAQFPVGTTNVRWTARRGSQVITCIQTVHVRDAENPTFTAPPTQVFCPVPGNNYTIPVPTYGDNCGILSVRYTITGATTRNGNGSNASGQFNPGISQVTWWITDVNLNTSTPITLVNVSNSNCITLTRPAGENNDVMNKGVTPLALKMELNAYPNPSQSYFNVRVSSPVKETVELRMYDNLGKVIEVRRGAPDQIFRFGDGVAAGMYIIEARQSGLNEKATIKVVKQN